MDAKSSWVSGRVKTGSLLVLACGVVGAATIHRLTHGVWFGDSGSTWPLPPEARRGEWTRWAAVPMQAPILGVWGASSDNVWAWGSRDIIHWDGRAWSHVERPNVDPGTIEDMGGSATAVWVQVVHSGRECLGPAGPHWDYWCDAGNGWRPGACPTTWRDAARTTLEKAGEAVYDPELERLSAARLVTVDSLAPFPQLPFVRGHRVGPNELWAIDAAGIFLGHFDGKRWTVGSTRSPLLADVNGLWFASETDGWAIAGPTILRWDGREWTLAARVSPVLERAGRDPTPRQPDHFRELRFHALWGSASDDVWAVGEAGVTMHWDGQSWTYVRRNDWPDLTVLAGRGRTDVWTGGCSGDAVVLLHWDGWNWRRWDAPSYQALDSRGTPCPVLASMGDGRVRALVEDRLLAIDAAGSWEPAIPAPARRLGARVARGERITALVAAGMAEAWALGSRESDRPPHEPSPFAVHFAQDAPPKVRPLPGHGTIQAVWSRGPDDVWAVGTDGLVLHFDGEFWTRLPIDTSTNLIAVHGAGRSVWIAGGGTLLRRRF